MYRVFLQSVCMKYWNDLLCLKTSSSHFCFVDLFLLGQKWAKFNQMEFYLFTGIYEKHKEN